MGQPHNHATDHPQVEVHPGHETYHNILFLLLLVFIVVSQGGLHYWKRKHYKSFQSITLGGLWIIPVILSLMMGFYRMLFVWGIFTSITGYLLYKATQGNFDKELPSVVYAWFHYMYKLCYGASILGYGLIMADLFGLSLLLSPIVEYTNTTFAYIGTMLLFYGLYYGVLGRDCAEVLTDRVASKMGYTGKGIPSKQIPPRTCCICGDVYDEQKAIQLNCKHLFHEKCIRGWVIIGKKDTCPYCSEKVEMKSIVNSNNPWDKQGIFWAHILDALRYLIVWNPIILTVIQVFLNAVD